MRAGEFTCLPKGKELCLYSYLECHPARQSSNVFVDSPKMSFIALAQRTQIPHPAPLCEDVTDRHRRPNARPFTFFKPSAAPPYLVPLQQHKRPGFTLRALHSFCFSIAKRQTAPSKISKTTRKEMHRMQYHLLSQSLRVLLLLRATRESFISRKLSN